MSPARLVAAAVVLLAGAAFAQQPNGAAASMLVGGAAGPPYPIASTVRTNTAVPFSLAGAPGAPLLVAASATGLVQPGSLATGGGLVDLPVAPSPVVVIDGFSNPQFALDATGAFAFQVQVPPSGPPPGGIPIGHAEAVQAVIADPNSPAGFTLAAATQVVVAQGPVIIDLVLGSDGAALIDTGLYGFSVPFFGANHTQLWVCVNGFVTLGLPDTDFTPSAIEFNTGYPRLAPFWSDLAQISGQFVRCTIDASPPGSLPRSVRVDWIGVADWGLPIPHTFHVSLDANGACELGYSLTNNASLYNTLSGIGPGLGQNPQAPKDLSVLDLGGGLIGAPYESFFELFPGPGTWGGTTTNPFDLFGVTLSFLPIGGGSLPSSTSAYLFY